MLCLRSEQSHKLCCLELFYDCIVSLNSVLVLVKDENEAHVMHSDPMSSKGC